MTKSVTKSRLHYTLIRLIRTLFHQCSVRRFVSTKLVICEPAISQKFPSEFLRCRKQTGFFFQFFFLQTQTTTQVFSYRALLPSGSQRPNPKNPKIQNFKHKNKQILTLIPVHNNDKYIICNNALFESKDHEYLIWFHFYLTIQQFYFYF